MISKYAIGCWGLAAVFILLAWVNPRVIYWGARAWRYRNPEANEPSPAAYTTQRIGSCLSAAVLTVMGFVLMHWEDQSTYNAGDVKNSADQVAEQVGRETASRSSILQPDYYLAVDTAMRKVTGNELGDLQFRSAGRTASGGEQFTISSTKTGNPYCLIVEAAAPVQGRLGVEDVKLSAQAHKGEC
ncbi:hypothetical protein AB0A70_25315 [Streptomyces morookaense]|uniref:hypothetical protein n=1 Tax=Streptomyces morookaense TaxID=1970 RepID=UPI00340D7DF0